MSFLSFRSAPARRWCRKTVTARYLSQHDGKIRVSSLAADQGSFEAAGIQPLVAASLRIAFPNVQKPTPVQRKLIRAITNNKYVLLQDDTGTGKCAGQSAWRVRGD